MQLFGQATDEHTAFSAIFNGDFVQQILHLGRQLVEIERLGDRTGVMSTVIAMAYANYGTVMHFTSSARHLEEIRRVTSRLSELVTESERARLDLQMLFGVQVWARAKVVPDTALARGEEAYRAAKLQGERGIEFLAAGGVALSLLELGDVQGADRWVGLAATTAATAPSRSRSMQLETWRGQVRAAAGDAAGARRHLENALALATESGRAPARCEAIARLAIEMARLAAAEADPKLSIALVSKVVPMRSHTVSAEGSPSATRPGTTPFRSSCSRARATARSAQART